jgi:hypothetical protein
MPFRYAQPVLLVFVLTFLLTVSLSVAQFEGPFPKAPEPVKAVPIYQLNITFTEDTAMTL